MPVEIPESFARRVDALGPHFCLVQGKDPSVGGQGWQLPEKLMYSNDPRLQDWLKKGNNYGVVCGYGIVVVEADHDLIVGVVEEKLPPTLTVLSGGHRKPHYYFLCSFSECKPLINPDSPERENIGHIKAQGGMVVGPGSIHPETKQSYVLLHDRPIAQITPEQLLEALKPFLISKEEVERVEAAAKAERSQTNIDLDILDVVPLAGLKRQGDEYYGPHPVHGSTTGRNFWVNPKKNCWHCFRHGTGGGPLLWLSVEERIIDCSEAGPGALRGEVFKKVLEKARERGLIKESMRETARPKEAAPADELEKIRNQMQEQLEIARVVDEIKGKDVFPLLVRTLSYTVKLDYIAKQFDLLHPISAYIYPINELKEAPTSEGKTYPIMQALRMFPEKDVWVLGGLSKTALAHDYGVPVDSEGNDLTPRIIEIQKKIAELEKEEITAEKDRKKAIKLEAKELKAELRNLLLNSARLISLENKIIVFVENPHPETWAALRPIMSHDCWEISYKFTDRVGSKGPLKQFTAILRGWPVFIAFKAEDRNPAIWDQILSRGTTVPVEMSKAKYRQAIQLEALKRGLPQPIVDAKLRRDDFEKCKMIIKAVKNRLLGIKEKAREKLGVREIPDLFWIPYYRQIGKGFPAEVGVHMRESQRFMTTIQLHAAINIYSRPVLEIDGVEYIICAIQDYLKAVELFFSSEAKDVIFSKIPKHKADFFAKVLVPLWQEKGETEGLTTEEIRKKYFEVFGKPISNNTLSNHYFPLLEDLNYITRVEDSSDKRRKLVVVLKETLSEENIPIYPQTENGDIFSFKELKEAFERDIKKYHHNPSSIKIKNYDGTELTLEELYKKFFCIEGVSWGYYFSGKKKPLNGELGDKNIPNSEKGTNGDKSIGDTNKRRCEVCGGPATTVIVREDGEHWLCDKCLANWEGNL